MHVLVRVLFISRIYGHLLPRRRSAVRDLSVGIRLFQDSPGRFRDGYGNLLRDCLVMMMMYLSSVYFGTLEMDLWLHFPSDGCDQFRDQASVQQMFR